MIVYMAKIYGKAVYRRKVRWSDVYSAEHHRFQDLALADIKQ